MARLHRHLNRETDVEADDPEAVLVAEEEARGLGVPAAARGAARDLSRSPERRRPVALRGLLG